MMIFFRAGRGEWIGQKRKEQKQKLWKMQKKRIKKINVDDNSFSRQSSFYIYIYA